MGDNVDTNSFVVDSGAFAQEAVQVAAQEEVQEAVQEAGCEVAQYDRDSGPMGWTMVCDGPVHPDRPIGDCAIGLGYRLTCGG